MKEDEVSEPGKFTLKAWRVSVDGFDSYLWYAPSRAKALAKAFDSFRSYRDDVRFKDFLRMARCWRETASERFGEPITVGGKPAFWVSCNRQYIEFVRPDSDVILCSHPYDVEPPEARRGTPYYQEEVHA